MGRYGQFFEADFVNIQHQGNASPDQCLVSKELSARFRPEILFRGHTVSYYSAGSNVPADHTRILFETNAGKVQLGLKMHPADVAAAASEDWAITVEKDLRVSALVSLLKAAHLTLFEMLGYRYCLSASGHFMGSAILGDFFAQHQNKSKADVITNASTYFQEFKNMVRPVVSRNPTLEGTAADSQLCVCETVSGIPWAFMIFIRTSQSRHGVLVPIFEHVDGVARFLSFLKSDGGSIEVRFTMFANGKFSASPKTALLSWPSANLQ